MTPATTGIIQRPMPFLEAVLADEIDVPALAAGTGS